MSYRIWFFAVICLLLYICLLIYVFIYWLMHSFHGWWTHILVDVFIYWFMYFLWFLKISDLSDKLLLWRLIPKEQHFYKKCSYWALCPVKRILDWNLWRVFGSTVGPKRYVFSLWQWSCMSFHPTFVNFNCCYNNRSHHRPLLPQRSLSRRLQYSFDAARFINTIYINFFLSVFICVVGILIAC